MQHKPEATNQQMTCEAEGYGCDWETNGRQDQICAECGDIRPAICLECGEHHRGDCDIETTTAQWEERRAIFEAGERERIASAKRALGWNV